MGSNEHEIISSWISAFNEAVTQANLEALHSCLESSCWFRDILVFGSSIETRHGHNAISAYLKYTLGKAQVASVQLDANPFGRPRTSEFGPGSPIIETAFDFETPKALGKGFARLNCQEDGGIPKAVCLMMMLNDWKGSEEVKNESGLYGGHTLSWGEVHVQRRNEIETDPQVIIVGGAQSGLQAAARFRQMGIRTLVIEQTARVGDVWRNRYPSLALHTPRAHHQFLYQPYPSNWPTFTPRDKLADWLEHYAETQDLVVW